MALIEYDEYKQRLRDLGPELEKLSAALDMDSARAEARKLEDETAQDGFWNDLERSQKVQQRLKQLQNKIARQDKLVTEWQDLTALCEMGQEAEDEELLDPATGLLPLGDMVISMERVKAQAKEYGHVRRPQRHPDLPCRRRRHRGPGLGPDALPDVHPLDGAPRLHLSDPGL